MKIRKLLTGFYKGAFFAFIIGCITYGFFKIPYLALGGLAIMVITVLINFVFLQVVMVQGVSLTSDYNNFLLYSLFPFIILLVITANPLLAPVYVVLAFLVWLEDGLHEKLFKHKHRWEVGRTIWPYEDGWGTYCPGCRMVLDTGLPKEEAERRCKELNRPEEER